MKYLLIDGFNLAYRCFYAIPGLTRSDGTPTNALHGWIRSLWMLGDQEKPDATTVFFDLGGSSRHETLHPEYKAQRKEMPIELSQQIEPLKQLTKLMGFKAVEQHGVESDDLLASEAVALAQAGHDALIVSSDKDFAQLVGEKISIMLPPPSANPKAGWRRLDPAGVKEKFGVPPNQIADYLALIGDTSDNIPGIPGVGPKTAAKWLADHGSLEGVISKVDELSPERFRAVVAEHTDRVRKNLKLVTLDLALPVVPIEKLEPQVPALIDFLTVNEMKGTVTEARKRYTQPELF